MKIVSLVPSITETLHYLGLEEEVIGVTKFCIHPEKWFRSKIRIGGTKNINIEKIKELKPDLIIANKEENVKEQIEELSQDFNVLLTDGNNFDEALGMIQTVGNVVHRSVQGKELVADIAAEFATLNKTVLKPAVYFIWKDPWMTAGGDTFISDMMFRAGFENIYKDRARYPEITLAELKEINPEYLLLSSEPYPFQQKHADELKQQFPGSKIILADGEMFSWYGSRMLRAASYFRTFHR